LPVLPNIKHEKFCQALFRGEPATKAYEAAGYRPHQGNSSRLRWFEMVQGRLAELQSEAARSSEISVQSLLRELEEARLKASSLEQYGTVVKSIEAKARLAGLFEQKIKVTYRTEPPDGTVDDIAGWLAAEDYQIDLTAEQKKAFGVLLQDVLAQINNFLAPFRAKAVPQISPPTRSPLEHERRRLEIERRRSNGR